MGKKEETSDPVQHTCRTTVLGLSRFKCAANFDVIFFLSHCLKPLALFIIQALWSEQHGNNVSRRHTPSDGPLTALHHLFLFFPLSLSLSFLALLFAVSILTLLPSFCWFSLSFFSLIVHHPFPLPLLSSLHQLFILCFIFCLVIGCLAALAFLYLIDFPLSPHVWPLISNSVINWSLISGWLIQGDHNNEDTDNGNRKPLSVPNTDAKACVL